MTETKFYIDIDGKYLGAFNGSSPDGGKEVAYPPLDGRQTWNGNEWSDYNLAVGTNKILAQTALSKSDLVALRCVKAGIQFPLIWRIYISELRAIINGGTGPLPTQPEYPEGT